MEFDIIYKNVEYDKYNREKVKKLFFNECDLILTKGNSKIGINSFLTYTPLN